MRSAGSTETTPGIEAMATAVASSAPPMTTRSWSWSKLARSSAVGAERMSRPPSRIATWSLTRSTSSRMWVRVEDRDLAPELAHQVEDLAATDRVEGADGLVEQQDGRRADERLGDAEPLAHAAGVRGGSPVGRIGQADPGEDGRRFARRRRGPSAG